MATAKKPAKKKISGPFVAAAVFCENIVEDSSGMLSAIRILDTINVAVPPHIDPPTKKNQLPLSLNLLLSFRSGDSPRRQRLKVTIESPEGKRKDVGASRPVEYTKEPHAVTNVKVKVNLGVHSSGVFWFDVFLDGKLMTRVPLNVVISQIGTPQPTTAGNSPKKRQPSRAS